MLSKKNPQLGTFIQKTHSNTGNVYELLIL